VQGEEHVVREGETIVQLARLYYGDFHAGVAVLQTANTLDEDEGDTALVAGRRLTVPAPRRETVSAGDTWATIAERTLGSARHARFLASANGGAAETLPEAGSEIVVPVVLAHRVGPNDMLASLARRYYRGSRAGIRLMREVNDLRGARLAPGRVVLVPLPDLQLTPEGVAAFSRVAGALDDQARARAQAEISAALPPLDALFRDGRYLDLVANASRLLGRTEATGNQLVTLNRLLGYAYVALGREDLAEAAFREALSHQPDLELNAVTTSPKILRVFRRARRTAESRPAP
jgi:hypothetical protein